MKKGIVRNLFNRVFHFLARQLPGATGLRPRLHRWRGIKVGKDVFIGDDVYIENEYPECVEIHDGVQISIRAIILAHTRGPGRIVLQKDSYVGPNTIIVTSAGRTLCIGEGAVVGAGVTITKDVPARTFVAPHPASPVARVTVPLSKAERLEDFIRGLVPIRSGSNARRRAH
jgi:acetyltransferase-like isoleucine patch superfamily enzyme